MNDKKLIELALQASKRAYCPYSGVYVGAALLAKSGKVYSGCNVENASYGATICAERSAVVQAVAAGDREFEAIAVVSNKIGITPCGICLQVLYEFAPDIMVITESKDGKEIIRSSLSNLLPNAFILDKKPTAI